MKRLNAEVLELLPRLFVLGPRKVSVSATRAAEALAAIRRGEDGAESQFTVRRAEFVRTVQDVLRAGWPWERVTVDDAQTFREIQRERRNSSAPASRVVKTGAD
jgi:hypothetical protein